MRLVAMVILVLGALVPPGNGGGTTTPPRVAGAPGAQPAPWTTPTAPFNIVGPVSYVGTEGLAAYLIETSDGLILLDGALPESAAVIEASIVALGFDPADIGLLLSTHAHADHVGTTAHFKALSGAEVAAMAGDLPYLESGGAADPEFGNNPALRFPPVGVDRVLMDGDTVSLGQVTLTARLGAGHTQGATTWLTTVEAGGETYDVVFPCCASVNRDTRLVTDPTYPGIIDDYRETFRMLAELTPDIWLAAHTEMFGFSEKRKRAATEGVSAWVDPAGYRCYVETKRQEFEERVAAERSASPGKATPFTSRGGRGLPNRSVRQPGIQISTDTAT